jgi:hypothetical protein
MTLHDLVETLAAFRMDLQESKDLIEYEKAVSKAYADFYADSLKKSKEELIAEMIQFINEG